MSSAISPEEAARMKKLTAKPMLYVGMVSILMVFAGLTSAYIVRQAEGNWLYFELPQMFYISTAVILVSSATMFWAQRAVKQNNQQAMVRAIGITLALGLAFCVTQFLAWGKLVDMGVFFAGHESNASGSFLYVLSGVHLAHLAGGIIALVFSYVKARLGRYSAENHVGLDVTATYWHFLDILWIYLLLFLLFIR